MTDHLLDQARDLVEGQIDFDGQKLCEQLMNILLSIVGAVAFIIGYALQDIWLAIYLTLGGAGILFLVTVPPWPFFNKHPVKWLPIGGGSGVASVAETININRKDFHIST